MTRNFLCSFQLKPLGKLKREQHGNREGDRQTEEWERVRQREMEQKKLDGERERKRKKRGKQREREKEIDGAKW